VGVVGGGGAPALPQVAGSSGSSPGPPLAGELAYVGAGPLAREHTRADPLVGERACAEAPCGRPPPQGAPRLRRRSGEQPLARRLPGTPLARELAQAAETCLARGC
jgi:hypothetical protein